MRLRKLALGYNDDYVKNLTGRISSVKWMSLTGRMMRPPAMHWKFDAEFVGGVFRSLMRDVWRGIR